MHSAPVALLLTLPVPSQLPGRKAVVGPDKADFVYASVRTSNGDSIVMLLLCSPLLGLLE